MFKARKSQQPILDYRGGRMAIAAVPGSGKTEVLSALAAQIVARGLDEGQEVLIVTLVNSAVDNFANRVSRFLQGEYGLLAGFGYRVRTLHGLSNDIVRERPELAGLSEDFGIADERECAGILSDAVDAGLREFPGLLDAYLDPACPGATRSIVERKNWPEHISEVAGAYIKRAKDRQWLPDTLLSWLDSRHEDLPLARFCTGVYADYQRALSYRGKVDFDDLLRLANGALRADAGLLERLRLRWPYVLEDEAQDSSELQQEMLELLTGPTGNWVRVGDTNQAVYQTFTTANPQLLREFLERPDVCGVEMVESGRSAGPIIDLANHLVTWAVERHPMLAAREAFRKQEIQPTEPGDSQSNPPESDCKIYFHAATMTPAQEVNAVSSALARWVPAHMGRTAAVLVPDNSRGAAFVAALRQRSIECIELLTSTSGTRDLGGLLAAALQHIADPNDPVRLALAFEKYWSIGLHGGCPHDGLAAAASCLRRCERVEDYVWPQLGRDWLASQRLADEGRELLAAFRAVLCRWQEAAHLPVGQLILLMAQDLFDKPSELAVCYSLSQLLTEVADSNPSWRFEQFSRELLQAVQNERRLGSLSSDAGFDPDLYPGKVVVTTMHKAKGLEWDRVHLTAVNSYDFPAADSDYYRSEPYYVRDDLSPVAEALSQLGCLSHDQQAYEEGAASRNARIDYVSERLRLLYVGITRARRELIVTWNTGRREGDPKQPAVAFTALRTYQEQYSVSQESIRGTS